MMSAGEKKKRLAFIPVLATGRDWVNTIWMNDYLESHPLDDCFDLFVARMNLLAEAFSNRFGPSIEFALQLWDCVVLVVCDFFFYRRWVV